MLPASVQVRELVEEGMDLWMHHVIGDEMVPTDTFTSSLSYTEMANSACELPPRGMGLVDGPGFLLRSR